MGAADEATLPYGITQDSIVVVPLVVIGLYATLSLLRTILEYAKSGTTEKGKSINSFNNDKQDDKTPAELFRSNTSALQYAKEISGPLHLSARGKTFLSVPQQNSQTFSTETQQETSQYTPEEYIQLVTEGKIPMSPKHHLIEQMIKEGKSEGATIVIMKFAKKTDC